MKQGITRESVAERIRGHMEASNMTLTELALRCGVDRGGLSKVVRGLRYPSVPTLIHIARSLNVTVERLIYPRARGVSGKVFKHIDRELPKDTLPLPVGKRRQRNKRGQS